MKRLKPFNEDAEVTGNLFRTFYNSAHLDHFQHILRAHNLDRVEDIDPNGWYSQTLCMEIFEEIAKQPAMFDELALGISTVKAVHIEDRFSSVEEALRSLPALTRIGQRNSGDYITVRFTGERRATIEDHTVWPHNTIYGVCWELVRTFCRDFVIRRVAVDIDPETGDEYGVYEATWEDKPIANSE